MFTGSDEFACADAASAQSLKGTTSTNVRSDTVADALHLGNDAYACAACCSPLRRGSDELACAV